MVESEFNPSEDDVDQLQQKALNKVQTAKH